jgi:hypothetical protein
MKICIYLKFYHELLTTQMFWPENSKLFFSSFQVLSHLGVGTFYVQEIVGNTFKADLKIVKIALDMAVYLSYVVNV